MEKLAGQIKKDNALCVSGAQKLRSEFDSAVKKIRVRSLKKYTNLLYSNKSIINCFRIMKISKQRK